MTDSDGKPVDPRFDPVFQRGFDGAVVTGLTRKPERTAPSSAATPVIQPLRGSAPTSSPLATPRADPAPASAFAPRDEAFATLRPTPPTATQAAEFEAPLEQAAVVRRPAWRNPFLIALVVLGFAQIIGGVTLASEIARRQGSGISSVDQLYLLFLIGQFGAPLLVILGFATLLGVLFLFAVDWQRTQRS